MSALPPKACAAQLRHVRFVPKADIRDFRRCRERTDKRVRFSPVTIIGTEGTRKVFQIRMILQHLRHVYLGTIPEELERSRLRIAVATAI